MSRRPKDPAPVMPAAAAPQHHAAMHPHPPRRKHIDWATRTVRLELFILLVGCALLLGALSLYLGFSTTASEYDQVAKGKYQAVFLNGGATSGQVEYSTYFGHVTKLNNKYMILRDIYYLTTSQSSSDKNAQPNIQLTKLGCQQLHSPYDEMVINYSQVAFWENLKDDGKVVSAIKQFQKQNPNGPTCNSTTQTQPSSNTPNNSGSAPSNTSNGSNP